MAFYSMKRKRTNWLKLLVGIAGLIAVVALAGAALAYGHYRQNLKARDADQTAYNIVIPSGSTPRQIGNQLKTAGLIRDAHTFELYVRAHSLTSKLQAGTYAIKSSMSVQQIAALMVRGSIVRNVVIILPAQRLDQIKDAFMNAKFDQEAVTRAFDANQYRDIPVLADLPPGASLEGYLYPDTFQRDAGTDPSAIVRQSLEEMDQHVTADIKAGFAANKLNIYQGVSLASVVEQEVSKPADRTQVAQVFLSRLKQNMPLGSDVTYFYSQHVHDASYDKTTATGLVPGPISNVTDSSLQAVAHPAPTNYLYFVTGDDGTTYFSQTLDEHNAQVQKYCHKLCGR